MTQIYCLKLRPNWDLKLNAYFKDSQNPIKNKFLSIVLLNDYNNMNNGCNDTYISIAKGDFNNSNWNKFL